MKTPTMRQRSSTSPAGMTPSRTESTTARDTAACAGPNICTACVAPLIVTLLEMIVSGLAGRFGATTARRFVWPSFWFTSAFANASPTGPSFEPMMRSMCATSLPSPTSDSPTITELAMCASPPARGESLRPPADSSRRPAEVGRASYTIPRMPVTQAPRGSTVILSAGREAIAAAAQLACVLEVSAEKPGNITPRHDFDDTSYEDMLRSAIALGPELGRAAERGVGETVLAAVRATRRVAGANTNLGIALLLAPLARAALRSGALRAGVQEELAGLTVDDARAAYAAIREAAAGGLDEPVEHDVRAAPTVTL